MARIIVLGSGGPVPNKDRFGTAHIVQSGGRNYLFDCGPATTYKLSKLGLSALDIDHLFISHHHFDHTAGLPAFLLTRWDHSTGNENPLQVYGPRNTTEIVDRLVGERGAFAFDWHARVDHPLSQQMHLLRGGSLPRPAPDFEVTDVDGGVIVETAAARVTARRVEHVQPQLESIAYRLDTDEVSIVFTGDARPCDHIVDLAGGADVLVTMCGNFQSELERKGVESGQIGSLGAAELAAESGVGQLLLVHMGPDISDREGRKRAIGEMSPIYSGEIVFTDEMTGYELRRTSSRPSRERSSHTHIARDLDRSSPVP